MQDEEEEEEVKQAPNQATDNLREVQTFQEKFKAEVVNEIQNFMNMQGKTMKISDVFKDVNEEAYLL